jgi:hypothetical protein
MDRGLGSGWWIALKMPTRSGEMKTNDNNDVSGNVVNTANSRFLNDNFFLSSRISLLL